LLHFSSPKKQFKTVQSARTDDDSGGFKGCFNSHPQKNSSKQFNPRGRMTVRVDSGVASILIPKKTVQNSSFKTELGVASFLIPKSFHI
jgi:hypothetical protein